MAPSRLARILPTSVHSIQRMWDSNLPNQ
jgi:hypothetical protein